MSSGNMAARCPAGKRFAGPWVKRRYEIRRPIEVKNSIRRGIYPPNEAGRFGVDVKTARRSREVEGCCAGKKSHLRET